MLISRVALVCTLGFGSFMAGCRSDDSSPDADAGFDAAIVPHDASLSDAASTFPDAVVDASADAIALPDDAAPDASMPSALYVEFNPSDDVRHVSPNVHIEMHFAGGDAIATSTLIAQSSDGACSGTVQLSADDFTTCLGGTIDSSADPITFTPNAPLALATQYKVRMTTDVTSIAGAHLDATYTMDHGFRTFLTLDEKLVFATVRTYGGDFDGPTGADALCASDFARPDNNGAHTQYKAFVVGTQRYACNVPNCATGSTSLDWVLTPNTHYVRRDGEPAFVSDARGVLDAMPMPVTIGGTNFWAGFKTSPVDWTYDLDNNCGDWTIGDISASGNLGWTTPDSVEGFVTGGGTTCGTAWRLLCVEQ